MVNALLTDIELRLSRKSMASTIFCMPKTIEIPIMKSEIAGCQQYERKRTYCRSAGNLCDVWGAGEIMTLQQA